MEQPLAAQRNKKNPITEVNELPSPNSDALGRELKKFGGGNANSNPASASTNSQPQYKSKFLQQYENNGNAANVANNAKVAVNDEEDFSNILRSDSNNKRSSGPGWNNDTVTDGFVANRKSNQPRVSKPAQAAANQQQNENFQDMSLQEFRGGFPVKNGHDGGRLINENMFPYDDTKNRSRNIPNSPRGYDQNSAAPTTTIMTRSAGDPVISQARAKLSLLKNKIQQSENSNSSRTLRKALSASEVDENFVDTHSSNNSAGKQYQPYVPNTRDNAANPPRNVRSNPIPPQNSKLHNNVGYHDQDDDDDMMAPAPNYISNNKGIASSNNHDRNSAIQNVRQSSVPMDSYTERSNLNRPPSGRQQQQQQPQQRQQPNQQYRNVENQSNGPPQQRQPQQQQQQQPPVRQQQPPPQQSDDEEEYGENDDYNAEDDGAEGDIGELMQCPDCGRKFGALPFSKHVKICAKVFLRKRKAFDSAKMRIQDNPELVKILSKAKKDEMRAKKKQQNANANADDRPVAEGAPKWKSQSEAFRGAMRAAREIAKAQASGAPLPPPVISAPDPSLIPCPHCGRRFNDKAADRHIPQCQQIKAKPTSLKRGNGITAAAGVGAKPLKR